MQTIANRIDVIEPHEPTIAVRVHPASITDAALAELREVARRRDRVSDCLRGWLGDCVAHEIARRNSDGGVLEEPPAWLLPWHQWDDNELANALAASYAWYDVTTEVDSTAVLREVHRAICTACCTRLGELHSAIQQARGRE
jgi:hypothetical protein